MPDQPRQTLCDLMQRFGPDLATDPKRCEAALKDLLPNGFKREINALVQAIREGVPSELLRPTGGTPLPAVVVQQARKLHEDLGLDQSLAEWAVASWATALGLKVAVSGQAAPAVVKTPPPPKPATGVVPTASSLITDFTNAVGGLFKLIEPGSFLMGDSSSRWDDEKPAHQVTITRPFYCGVFPVTQAEYQSVMGQNPSRFKGPRRPVEEVSWDDAMAFCAKLNQRNEARPAGMMYRLLTEAEWEYCCRAGTTTSWCCSSEGQLGDYAWYGANASSHTYDVGTKKANSWGLHDFHGNVWEWVHDGKDSYSSKAEKDPVNLVASLRVYRGGSWYDGAANCCRSAYRGSNTPYVSDYILGFRLALGHELK